MLVCQHGRNGTHLCSHSKMLDHNVENMMGRRVRGGRMRSHEIGTQTSTRRGKAMRQKRTQQQSDDNLSSAHEPELTRPAGCNQYLSTVYNVVLAAAANSRLASKWLARLNPQYGEGQLPSRLMRGHRHVPKVVSSEFYLSYLWQTTNS
jgi:hypothetical protein